MTEHSSVNDIEIWQDEEQATGAWVLVAVCRCGHIYTCTTVLRSQAWQLLQTRIADHARARCKSS